MSNQARNAARAIAFAVSSVWLLSVARADSHLVEGHYARVSVSVFTAENERSGAPRWFIDSARKFARWARAVDSILPAGTSTDVRLNLEEDRETYRLEITIKSKSDEIKIQTDLEFFSSDEDYSAIMSLIARHFKVQLPKIEQNIDIYTIQIFALTTYNEKYPNSEFNKIENIINVKDFLYYETCLPCSAYNVRLLSDEISNNFNNDGIFRFIVGNYATEEDAKRVLAKLKRDHKIDGFVRKI